LPVDQALTAALETDLRAGGGDALRQHFRGIGAPVPQVQWAPAADSLDEAALRALYAYWLDLPPGPRAPRAADIDPLRMRGALGYVMLMDAVDDGRDFRYRLYGSAIAERSGFDATGKLISEIAVTPLREFFLASYRACRARVTPLFTRHVPPYDVHVVSWDRLILPLNDGQGGIDRLLVGNVPGSWGD
jgi:hypothetical protein